MDREWNDSQPIYRQLRDRVVAMILDGVLKEGDPLPSVARGREIEAVRRPGDRVHRIAMRWAGVVAEIVRHRRSSDIPDHHAVIRASCRDASPRWIPRCVEHEVVGH